MNSNRTLSRLISFIFLFLVYSSNVQSQDQLTEKKVLELAEENIEKHRKADVRIQLVDEKGNPLKGVNLEIKQKTQDFLFGALVFDLVWEDRLEAQDLELFKQRFSELFNLALFPFYWGAFEPSAGHPRWDRIEPVLDWCLDEGITCKGHPLGWTHSIGLPDYLLDLTLEESETLLEARIIENVTGFRDRITMWDVVNEPINTVSWEMAHLDRSKEHRYRSDLPINDIADWVEKAYKTAHGANPENEYILNEFKLIADPFIRQRFYDFTEELIARETPITGLGLQAHEPREEWFNPVDVWETLELYKDFGLPIHITEFIPQSAGAEITGGYKTGQWTPETQAEYTETMYRIWFGHPSVVSINWWGFSDANSWLPGGGFVDDRLTPKPVYHTLKKLIKEEWTTSLQKSTTNDNGEYSFRGFHGEYEVRATHKAGHTQVFNIHLPGDDSGTRILELH